LINRLPQQQDMQGLAEPRAPASSAVSRRTSVPHCSQSISLLPRQRISTIRSFSTIIVVTLFFKIPPGK
jgi:hypothetical protein